MVTPTQHEQSVEYTIPEGCPVCSGDLQVKVLEGRARGVCIGCGYFASPTLVVTHRGLRVDFATAQA